MPVWGVKTHQSTSSPTLFVVFSQRASRGVGAYVKSPACFLHGISWLAKLIYCLNRYGALTTDKIDSSSHFTLEISCDSRKGHHEKIIYGKNEVFTYALFSSHNLHLSTFPLLRRKSPLVNSCRKKIHFFFFFLFFIHTVQSTS
jgi:hypothetical protein